MRTCATEDATPLAVEPAQKEGVAINGRSGARIGCTACRVHECVTVADDRDLHPDLLAGTDRVIEERIDGGGKMVFRHVDDLTAGGRRTHRSRARLMWRPPDGVPYAAWWPRRRAVGQGRSRMTAMVSRSWVSTVAPTLPRTPMTRCGETARMCWHWAAEVPSSPFA